MALRRLLIATTIEDSEAWLAVAIPAARAPLRLNDAG